MTHLTFFKLVMPALFVVFCAGFFISCTTRNMPQNDYSSHATVKPEDRYIIHDTGIILDKITSLEWYSSDTPRLQEPATRYSLSLLKKEDLNWRLPTRSELYDLYKNGRTYNTPLKMHRDTFWIQNYHVYDLFSNTVIYFPSRSARFGGFEFDNYDRNTAFLLVVRSKAQES